MKDEEVFSEIFSSSVAATGMVEDRLGEMDDEQKAHVVSLVAMACAKVVGFTRGKSTKDNTAFMNAARDYALKSDLSGAFAASAEVADGRGGGTT